MDTIAATGCHLLSMKTPLSDLSQVSAEWLTQTLVASGCLTRGRVARVIRDIRRQSNYSMMARLQVSYTGDAVGADGGAPPAALLLKFNSPGRTVRSTPSFEPREVEFYNAIAPAMTHQPSAHCYHAAYDAHTGGFHILLEDLSATHACAGKALPPTLAACGRMVDSLACFHAAWWNDARLGTRIGSPFREERRSRYAATNTLLIGKFVARLGDRISSGRRETLRKLCMAYPRLLERQGAGPLTLTHSDTHAQNFLVSRTTADCRIIDWQSWEIAPATDDLAFMMALQWNAERRGRLERAFLRQYHRALCAAGVGDYAWETCWKDYRLSVIKQLCTPIYVSSYGVQPAAWWENLERVFAAYEDLDCVELLQQLV